MGCKLVQKVCDWLWLFIYLFLTVFIKLWKTQIQKDIFSILFTLKLSNDRFQFGMVIQKENLRNLKLFYLNQLQWIIVPGNNLIWQKPIIVPGNSYYGKSHHLSRGPHNWEKV
jgi:hypothetical protein